MRILINAASAHMGGSVTYVQNVLKELPGQCSGGRLIVYVPEKTAEALSVRADVDIRTYPFASTQGFQRLYFDQVRIPRLARQENVDVLFSATGFGTLWSPVPQVLLVRNMKYFDPQLQAKYHELGRSFLAIRLRRWHSLLSIRAAETVLFPTRGMKETVETLVSLDSAATQSLHYGFDREKFGEAERGQSGTEPALRQRIPKDGPVLLNVSTYAVHKNLETVIEALPSLLNTHPDLTFVTTTSRERTTDKTEYDALKDRAAELGVANAWVELGYTSHDNLPALYRAADLYVFPSFAESFGHSMVEAMASGLPIVSSDTEVHREVCGDAAAYFDALDATGCAESIREVLNDEVQRAAMARAATCRALHFSWEQYVERLADIFQRVTARRT